MPPDAAIEHALKQLENQDEIDQNVFSLAILKRDENIHPYIDQLASKGSPQNLEQSQYKFLYLVLKWIYENREIYVDPLELVEIIYSDFAYPELISNFVRYMPSKQPPLSSLDLYQKRLYDNWKMFLDTQEQIWKKKERL